MRRRRFHSAVISLLIALVLGAGIASKPAPASAETPAAPEAGTITTELQPGWNMVGWAGHATPSRQLFEELPELRWLSAWDAEHQRYQMSWRRHYQELPWLMPGMGLWLLIHGDAPVEWTRPIAPDGAVLRLRRGLNLVGWTGQDGTSLKEALGPVADGVVSAWDRDARSGEYAAYSRSGHDAAGSQLVLSRGAALWVQVSEAVNWRQSTSAEPPIAFLGEIPEHIRTAIVAEYENVERFFAERFGVVPRATPLYVGADVESLRATHLELFGSEPEEGFCGRISSDHVRVYTLSCAYPVQKLGLHVTQVRALLGLRDFESGPGGPEWMFRGTQRYAGILYAETARSLNYKVARRKEIQAATRAALPLSSVDMRGNEDRLRSWAIGGVGFLAVEWLAARAGDPAIFEYYRLLPSAETWQEAFATAFGITVEDFYAEFEAYRAELAPAVPHLADDQEGAAVVFLGDVPEDTRATILADMEKVRAFMTERFDAQPPEFTLYVGPDTHSILVAVPEFSPSSICTRPAGDTAAIDLDLCGYRAPHDSYYILALVPTHEVPPQCDTAAVGLDLCVSRAPHASYYILAMIPAHDVPPRWLAYGAGEYATTAYRAEAKGLDLEDNLAGLRRWVRLSSRSLESRETPDGAFEAGLVATRALGYFAVERLVERAGEPALFDFYEQQPTHANWKDIFEATFGISVEDFYEEFEASRSEIIQE